MPDPEPTPPTPNPPPPGAPPATPPAAPVSAETVTALSGRLREETEKRQAAEQRAAHAARLEQTVAVYHAVGLVDAELADQVIANWSRLPAENRPEIGAWVGQLRPTPPKWLAGYLGQPGASPSPPPAPPPASPPPAPTGGAGGAVPLVQGGSANGPAMTAATMAQLRAEAKKTGDWSKVQAAVNTAKKMK